MRLSPALLRTRWAAIGAAVAVALGGGAITAARALTSSNGAVFVPVSPCRLFDTRSAAPIGPRSAPLGNGESFEWQVTGNNGQCSGIPAQAASVALNVTVVNATEASYLTVYPANLASSPLASSLNWVANQPPTPNAVNAPLSPAGAIKVFNAFGTVDVVADVTGYFLPPNITVDGAQVVDGSLTLADLASTFGDTSYTANNVALAAQGCLALGLADGGTGKFAPGKLVIVTFRSDPGNQNLRLYGGTTRSNGAIGIAPFRLCVDGAATTLNGTYEFRVTVVG